MMLTIQFLGRCPRLLHLAPSGLFKSPSQSRKYTNEATAIVAKAQSVSAPSAVSSILNSISERDIPRFTKSVGYMALLLARF
jgi:hypothetical protein